MINDSIRDDLSALIDGELSPERRREIEATIAADPELRSEYERLRRVDALYAALPRESVPPDFETAVRARIAKTPDDKNDDNRVVRFQFRRFRGTPRMSLWPLAAAAVLLIACSFWVTMSLRQPGRMMLSKAATAPAMAPPKESKSTSDDVYKVQLSPGASDEKKRAVAETVASSAAPAAAPVPASPSPAPTTLEEQAVLADNEKGLLSKEDKATPAQKTGGEVSNNVAGESSLKQEVKPQGMAVPERSKEAESYDGLSAKAEQRPAKAPEPLAEAPQPASPVLAAPAKPTESKGKDQPLSETVPRSEMDAGSAVGGSAAGAKAKDADRRTVADRNFLRVEAGWNETGYAGESTRDLDETSKEIQDLLKGRPELRDALTLGGVVTLKIDGTWLRIKTERPISN